LSRSRITLERVERDPRRHGTEAGEQAADVPQQTGRLAGVVLHDRAARRIFSARRNSPFSQTLRFVDGARVKLIARIT